MKKMKKDIKNLSLEELKRHFIEIGEKPYRAEEIFRAIYKSKIFNFYDITTLPKTLRDALDNQFFITSSELISKRKSSDSSIKFLIKFPDNSLVETVLIKDTAHGKTRNTLCLSSQVGCAMKCKFCATGQMGFTRNLTVGEIIEQFLLAEKIAGKINNIVFMGMGEPLANYENVKKAIEIITDNKGRGLGKRKIVISTSGIIDKIYKLTDEIKSVKLAISLHAATQEKRDYLMPGLRNYKISNLFEALKYYNRKTGNTITIEYLLIKDVNDDYKDAKDLIKLLRTLKFVKVNLIHFNRVAHIDFKSSSREKVFAEILKKNGITVTIRHSKGEEISAACGQLATDKNIATKFKA